MTRWERLEEWIFDHEHDKFTSRQVAVDLNIPNWQASKLIQAYLDTQRRSGTAALYVLKREGRTSRAVWTVGQRTADARAIGNTLFEDMAVKIRQAFKPDLEQLKARNPRAARYCDMKIEAVAVHALQIMAAAIDRYDDGAET